MKKVKTNFRTKKTVVPSPLPALDDRISLSSAIATIAFWCNPAGRDERGYKKRVRQRISEAFKQGRLSRNAEGIRFGELIEWARQKKDWSIGMNANPIALDHPLEGTIRNSASLNAELSSLPHTLHDCQNALQEAQQKLVVLEQELNSYREFCSEFLPMIETGLKVRKQKHRITYVQKFCRRVAD